MPCRKDRIWHALCALPAANVACFPAAYLPIASVYPVNGTRRVPTTLGWRTLLLLLVWASCFTQSSFATEPAAEFDPAHVEKMEQGLKLFQAEVRGIFIEHCLDCHGGDEVESRFDLATRKGLMRGGAHGAAVVSGKAKESRLVALISHNENPNMPEGGDKLPPAAIEAVATWIDLGAPYDRPLVENPRDPDAWVDRKIDAKARDHWAFKPLATAAPPKLENDRWSQTNVDRYVLAKLREKKLEPNPLADRRRLIRRAYYDLIGLPPTAAETEAFVADPDPEAHAKLIERLLESPHYGERWGRHWLDTARFAESHGFEQDYDRPHAYVFRDFVIEALNQDMPFDQFVRWQLAGDEYEPENPLALKATGFLGAGVFPTQITANEVERTRYDALDDMIATTGTSMLGLTIGCARCHDHKFDPIPAGDYYRLINTFATTVRSNLDVNIDPVGFRVAKEAFDKEHAPLLAARDAFEKEQLPQRLAEWEASESVTALQQSAWQVLKVVDAKSKGGATLTPQEDGSILASGKNPDQERFTFTASLPAGKYTGIRLEALAHPSLVKGGPGRASNGNFALSDFRVTHRPAADKKAEPKALKLTNPQATFEQTPQNLYVRFTIDDNPQSAWAVDPQFGKDHVATFELAEPLEITEAGVLTFTLDFNNNTQHGLGRPRLSITSAASPLPLEQGGVPAAVQSALATAAAERTAEQKSALMAFYKPLDAEWKKLQAAVDEHQKSAPKPKVEKMMVCSEGVTPIRHHTQGADFFEKTYYLQRGDSEQKQGEATQGFLQVLTTAPEGPAHWQQTPPAGWRTSYRRRALAEWMTDTEYGAGQLLARVIVNRLWVHHLGRGLVSTPNDFGLQGTPPTHPELLDYLATELIRGGWKLKPLHKLLMTSSVYMQDSTFDEADAKADPPNEFLWRFTPRRLEAEIIRDSMLAVSNELDRRQFGPGTLDENHKRRSIYFMIKRSKLVTMMQIFDQPEPLVSVGNRPTTTIAPQALYLMNNSQVRQCAASLAKQLLMKADVPAEEIVQQGYLQAFSRLPTTEESADAVAFLAGQEQSYAEAKKDQPRLRAATDFCQVLLELNEFVYVE